MKKSIIPIAAMVAIAFGTISAQADDNRPYRSDKPGMGCQKGQDHFQRMADRLKLTDEQQAKARAIFDDSRKKMDKQRDEKRALRQEMANLDPASRDYDEKVRDIADREAELTEKSIRARAETRKQFHMLLTEEQRTQAREMRQRMQEKMQQRKDDRRDGGWQERDRPGDRQERGQPM